MADGLRRRAGVVLRRLSGGGGREATDVYCQFNEGDKIACSAVHGSARQSPERRETPGAV